MEASILKSYKTIVTLLMLTQRWAEGKKEVNELCITCRTYVFQHATNSIKISSL